MELYNDDCLNVLRKLPDQSVNLVLTDPPYNVAVRETRKGTKKTAEWDRIDNYIDWCVEWLTECQRVLTPNGVLYFWHNDMVQIAQLMEAIRRKTKLYFVSFCIWDKGEFRARSWKNRVPDTGTAPRSWFNVCEYCLHYFNTVADSDRARKATGLDRINSNPACYKPLKDWMADEKNRLGLTDKQIAECYTQVTGKKPYMLRHYFQDSQFEIPTQDVWERVYMPLGFGKDYEALRKDYEALRKDYEALRNPHHCDAEHCNIWHIPPIPSNNRFHTCEKPVNILRRLVRVSSNPGDVVLDCFMGSGSTGVACAREGRDFVGVEKDPEYFRIAKTRIEQAQQEGQQLTIL